MKYQRLVEANIVKKPAIHVVLFALGFTGCASTDANYADRNDIDSARSRCVEFARSSGYRDIAVDSIERDGRAEWNVKLLVRKDGRDKKERCEYNARTNRVHLDD